MYWVEGTEIMSQKSCFSLGPPVYSWGGWILGGGLSNIPDSEASTLWINEKFREMTERRKYREINETSHLSTLNVYFWKIVKPIMIMITKKYFFFKTRIVFRSSNRTVDIMPNLANSFLFWLTWNIFFRRVVVISDWWVQVKSLHFRWNFNSLTKSTI